jgi:segregation and condensation protein B
MDEIRKSPMQDESAAGETPAEGGADLARAASILESLLLVSAQPLPLERIGRLLGGLGNAEVRRVVEILKAKYPPDASGILVEEIARGLQLRTNPANQEHVRRLFETRPVRFSRPSLETLAVIAYRQPVTRLEIEEVRGVDCAASLRTLMDRRLVKVVGKKNVAGRPFLFGTTREFLEVFGLESLSDLPSMRDIEDFLASAAGALVPRPAGKRELGSDEAEPSLQGGDELAEELSLAEHGEPLVATPPSLPDGISDDALADAASKAGVIYADRKGFSVPGPTQSKYEFAAGFLTFDPAEPLVTEHSDLPEGVSEDEPDRPED